MKCDLDSFLGYFAVVRVINLNKDDWAKSKCSCGWFMKNYNCYHLIVVATNTGLVNIPNKYKNVNISAKAKRGREPLAKKALEKQAHA